MCICQLVFRMKKYIFLFFYVVSFVASAQIPGLPTLIPFEGRRLLDQVGETPSFAFSTRKLRQAYVGPALKLRRGTDNAVVDVSFDSNGIVSENSIVTIVEVGTSSEVVGNVSTLSSFKGVQNLFVVAWYDQSGNNFHAVQTTAANQPPFQLSNAGQLNTCASLSFTGTSRHHLVVNQTLPTLLTNGLEGTAVLIAKPTVSVTSNNSFGYFDPVDNTIRWSVHLNWPDGNCYSDLSSTTNPSRAFSNVAREGMYKQYVFLRNANTKTVKVSRDFMFRDAAQTSNNGLSGGNFGIGVTTGNLTTQNGFTGNISEFILFKTGLNPALLNILETEQLSFWLAF